MKGTFEDGHRENLTNEAVFTSNDFQLAGNKVMTKDDIIGTVNIAYTDFMGQPWSQDVTVAVGTMRGVESIETDADFASRKIYSLQGVKVATGQDWPSLPSGIYVVNGKKYVKN